MLPVLRSLVLLLQQKRAFSCNLRKLRINLHLYGRCKRGEARSVARGLLHKIAKGRKKVSILEKKVLKARKARRYWVRPIFRDHKENGAWFTLIPNMKKNDIEKYYNFFRMYPETFDKLLSWVGPHIRKATTWLREPISEGERLAITLRYFASGDSFLSLSYQFLVSDQIISEIVLETAVVLWVILEPIVFKPLTEEMWLEVAAEYEVMWNFPHCCGAIDGKHVYMHAPAHSGSRYFNYKKRFSIILMGVASAKRKFIAVDVGGSGRRGDGNVFQNSALGKLLAEQKLNIPPPCPEEGIEGNIPFALIGDGAFERSTNLLSSFQKKKGQGVLPPPERVFNVRFSGARHCVEDAFGLLYRRYGVFQKSIQGTVTFARYVTLACCALHNLHLMDNKSIPPSWKRKNPELYSNTVDEDGKVWPGRFRNEDPEAEQEAFERLCKSVEEVRLTQEEPAEDSMVGEDIREVLLDYFINNPVKWQWKKACVG